MKYFYSFLIAFLCISSIAFAQSNYKPGYTITLSGDTTHGFINYHEWNTNPTSFDFKNSPADKAKQVFSAHDLRGFAVSSEAYISYTGPVTNDETNPNRVNGRDTSVVVKSIFLKLLQRGANVALYRYEDDIKARYFISEGKNTPIELILRIYYTDKGTVTESTYKKQLSILASKYDRLNDAANLQIQRAEYSEDDILKVVSLINNYKALKANTATDLPDHYWYAGAGVNITPFSVGGGVAEAGASSKTSIMPFVTRGINIFANAATQKVNFRLEAGIGANRYTDAYTSKVSPYDNLKFNFTEINLSVSPQILYNLYNQPEFKFYGSLGGIVTYNKYVDKQFSNADGTQTSLLVQPFFFKAVQASGIAKAGFVIKNKFDIYVSYITRQDLNKDDYFTVSKTTVQTGINFLFK
jgi:hypothetical protein